MNIYTILNGRLVQDPRFFNTKGGEEMCSIRLADNPVSKRPEEYKTLFIEVTLPPGLTKVVQDRGIGKGDVVAVSGELEMKEYARKKAKRGEPKTGTSMEIRFPKSFLVLTQTAKGDNEFPPKDAEVPDDEAEGDENAFDAAEEE